MSGHERSNITVCQSNYSGHKIVVLVVYQALKRRILMYRDIHLDHPLNKISYTIDRHRPCDRVAPPSKPNQRKKLFAVKRISYSTSKYEDFVGTNDDVALSM